LTQKVRIESIEGHYTVAVQCGPNEPFTLQPGEIAEVSVWPNHELRVYELGLVTVDQPRLV
jgi:hypothetical protein